MPSVQEIEWEDCLVETRRNPEMERYARQAYGLLPSWVAYFATCPWLVRTLVHISHTQLRLVYIDLDLAEFIALVVSQDNSCRYCYAANRALLKILGFPEERIRRLEQGLLTAELSPRHRAALEFARRVSRSNPMPSRLDLQPLRDVGYDDGAIKEIAFLTVVSVYQNRVSTLPAIPTESAEHLADLWYMRAFRPLFARFIHWKVRRGQPESLTPEERAGPFAYLVAALDGLPVAKTLRRMLDELWGSPCLPQRSKALVFAVVARGLGCPLSEREAVRLLHDHSLTAEDVEEILSHLASPKLDPIEAEIVPFARETIWYRPAPIQRRARKVREHLSTEQFLELVGAAALANAVCRLAVVVDRPDLT